MSEQFSYDAARDPPAPVLPARIGGPGESPAVLLGFLVDSGADMTVVPEALVRNLRLPAVSQISVRGVGGILRRARVYAAEIDAAGTRVVVEVLGIGSDALLGRDVLNGWVTTLRGPQRVLEVTAGPAGSQAGRDPAG